MEEKKNNKEAKPNAVSIRFGELIRQTRLQRKLTQQEVADRLEISQTFFARIESGQRTVDLPTAIKLCRFFELDLNDFMASF